MNTVKQIWVKFFFQLFFLALFISCGNRQVDTNRRSEYIIGGSEIDRFDDSSQIREILSGGEEVANIVDFLPKDFDTTAKTDYTEIIQKVLDSNSLIEFPDFPLLINDNGLTVRSNSSLFFKENSLLKLKSSDKISYKVLNLTGVQDISIFSPKIEGDRYRRIDSTNQDGEWGMGIFVKSSKNITINNPMITKCWGDGIYIGGCHQIQHNENIQVNNPVIENVRRNGISITCGKHVKIIDAKISNIRGTSPESGIDIEPNKESNLIEDIYIKNPFTFNNATHGIVISLGGLIGSKENQVSIHIENHIDEHSTYGFTYASNRKEKLNTHAKDTGKISLYNLQLKFNKKAFLIGASKGLFPMLEIKEPKIYTLNQGKSNLDVDEINNLKSQTYKSDVVFK